MSPARTTGAALLGLVGDPSPDVRAHGAIPIAVRLASSAAGPEPEVRWIPTASIDPAVPGVALAGLDGVWCVPGSPYENMDGVLAAIRYARENGVPFLGTCGGFQHLVIEYARTVVGAVEADHAESNPCAPLLIIERLACGMSGVDGEVRLLPGTPFARFYGCDRAMESYQCNYGLEASGRRWIEGGALQVGAEDLTGLVRGVWLEGHPFFLGTLYQPELSALAGASHPLVSAFLQAARARGERGNR